MTITSSIIFFILSICVRIPFISRVASDAIVHNYFSFLSKSSRRSKINTIRIKNGYHYYPNLIYIIARDNQIVKRYFNAFFDSFALLLIAIYVNLNFGETKYSYLLILIFSPLLLTTKARLKTFSARTFGFFLVTLFEILLLLPSGNEVLISFGLVIIGIVIILSSSFASQFVVLASILMCLMGHTRALPFLVVIILYFFHPDGKRLIMWKLNHLVWYRRNALHQNSTGKRQSEFFLDFLNSLRSRDVKKSLRILLLDSPIFASLALIPYIIYFAYDVNSGISHLLITVLIIVIATSIKPLTILGESQRYIEFALFPLSVIAINWTDEILWAVFGYNLILSSISLAFNRKASNMSNYRDYAKDSSILTKYVLDLKLKRIIALPSKMAFDLYNQSNGEILTNVPHIADDQNKVNGFANSSALEDGLDMYNYSNESLLKLVDPRDFVALYSSEVKRDEYSVLRSEKFRLLTVEGLDPSIQLYERI